MIAALYEARTLVLADVSQIGEQNAVIPRNGIGVRGLNLLISARRADHFGTGYFQGRHVHFPETGSRGTKGHELSHDQCGSAA